MKKVLFVLPPRWHEMQYPAIGAMGKMVKLPPLGMLFISSVLKRRCNVETRLFDFNLYDDQAPNYGVIDSLIREFQPDIIGMTAYTYTMFDVYEVVKRIKALSPETVVVLGGKHCQIYPRQTLRQPFVDYLVVGEGEYAMADLVAALDRGERAPKIVGVWYRRPDGGIVDGGMAGSIKTLDELPLPDIALIDREQRGQYGYRFGSGPLEATMYTSRGCPWKCTYCLSAYSDHKYYYHSPEGVLAGVEQYVKDGYGVIHFMDDHFNINIARAKNICRLLIERKYGIRWTMRGSAKYVDAELADLLQASGCERINLGVESAHDGVLASFERYTSVDQIRKAFETLSGRGIALSGYFIIGWPQEDRAMAMETIALAKSLPLDFAQFTPLSPAPGTPFLHELMRDGRMPNDPYSEYTESPTPVFKFPYIQGKLSEVEVAELLEKAYAAFYLRPRLIWRHASKLRSPVELARKAFLGMRLAAFSLKRIGTGRRTSWEPTAGQDGGDHLIEKLQVVS
jgi:anaerobic magnesium-protoporphyrin IX monomethyl ester cyclase